MIQCAPSNPFEKAQKNGITAVSLIFFDFLSFATVLEATVMMELNVKVSCWFTYIYHYNCY